MANGRGFEYVFPAIRGVQAQREHYTSMCPLPLIPKIFLFDEEELVPELRAQRTLNRNRIPEMTRYVVENPTDYVFSSLTASIDGDLEFEELGGVDPEGRVGLLHVPMSARFIINDGQHRRAAIERALIERPELQHETISVVFFVDVGLHRSQQMFADLNRHAIRPSRSLGALYDHRDPMATIAKTVAMRADLFKGVVEMERSTLSERSRKLFTLSAIYSATKAFIGKIEDCEGDAAVEQASEQAVEYWNAVGEHMPNWPAVQAGRMSAGEVRRDFIHSHGIVLQALGRFGRSLVKQRPQGWRKALDTLSSIDWSRDNAELWEGRAMIGGRVSKASQSVTLTTNALKQVVGLDLNPEEEQVEAAFRRGEYAKET
jgi:DNA sulfur modification protein DndB